MNIIWLIAKISVVASPLNFQILFISLILISMNLLDLIGKLFIDMNLYAYDLFKDD